MVIWQDFYLLLLAGTTTLILLCWSCPGSSVSLVAFSEGYVLLLLLLFSCLFFSFLLRNRPEGKVLETVGVFEVPKQNGKYETGQVSAGLGLLSFSWCALLLKGSDMVHRPECYSFLVPDQNHICLKVGVCFLGFECISCLSGFFFQAGEDRDG